MVAKKERQRWQRRRRGRGITALNDEGGGDGGEEEGRRKTTASDEEGGDGGEEEGRGKTVAEGKLEVPSVRGNWSREEERERRESSKKKIEKSKVKQSIYKETFKNLVQIFLKFLAEVIKNLAK
ncbi:hypothetical protein ACLB2K_003979 [Fragaria x ananassa]